MACIPEARTPGAQHGLSDPADIIIRSIHSQYKNNNGIINWVFLSGNDGNDSR